MTISLYQQGGFGTAPIPAQPIISERDPTSNDTVSPTGAPYQFFQGWNNELTGTSFIYLGMGNWRQIDQTVGDIDQITSDAGVVLPVLGNVNIVGGAGIATSGAGDTLTIALTGGGLAIDSFVPDAGVNPVVPTALGAVTMAGTANQIITTGGLNTLTFSLPAAVIITTSVTTGSFITSSATLGVTYSANTITATGSDADIDIGLVPKGTGAVMVTGPLSASTTLTAGTGITATTGNIAATNGNLVLGTAGNKLEIAVGASASAGTATLAAGTATVLTTAVTANSLIFISRKSIGATGANPLGLLVVGTVTAGTSFVINAVTEADATSIVATDVSEVDWLIIN